MYWGFMLLKVYFFKNLMAKRILRNILFKIRKSSEWNRTTVFGFAIQRYTTIPHYLYCLKVAFKYYNIN